MRGTSRGPSRTAGQVTHAHACNIGVTACTQAEAVVATWKHTGSRIPHLLRVPSAAGLLNARRGGDGTRWSKFYGCTLGLTLRRGMGQARSRSRVAGTLGE